MNVPDLDFAFFRSSGNFIPQTAKDKIIITLENSKNPMSIQREKLLRIEIQRKNS